ncbi:hypothetical protein, partial [Staphylococcus aureus]
EAVVASIPEKNNDQPNMGGMPGMM